MTLAGGGGLVSAVPLPTGTRRLAIVERARPYPLAVAGPGDFIFRDEGEVDPEIVMRQPGFSLYCVDPSTRTALFVQTPDSVELARAPFYYQAQHANALAAVAVPFAVLPRLAQVAIVDPTRLILLYSVGRCGSTLVASALTSLGGVTALSEPDVFTQLVGLRGTMSDSQLSELVRLCVRIVCGTAAPGRTVALKFRSFVVEISDLIHLNFPSARRVFLYRHVVDWSRSSVQAFTGYDPSASQSLRPIQDRLGRMVPLMNAYRAAKGRLLTPVEMLACQWVSQVDRALSLRRPLHAVRYEDLVTDPDRAVGELFAFCGLPEPVGLEAVLANDSQAGTTLAQAAVRDRPVHLDEAELNRAVAELWGELLAARHFAGAAR
ncbi:sulfotransferase family protein [Rhizocola hellebori]|uniref:Sulfotransferase family protein n=1 Tax=Rhizocola hellebori TaxID=1392758 RepID=A0A8J3QH76_9ACTN|nr:sulfotransferase [Rhizocola hellebori]GIH10561.1 sulfotransferase family protein [Rhizocola hellebori]